MPTVVATSPVEGVQPLETVEVSEERAKFLINEGYAYAEGERADQRDATSVEAAGHPMLAENREGVDEDTPTPEGEGNAAEELKDAVVTRADLRARQAEADEHSAAVVEATKDLKAPEELVEGPRHRASAGSVKIGTFREKQRQADAETEERLSAAADVTPVENVAKLPRTLPLAAEEAAKRRADRRAGGAAEVKPSKAADPAKKASARKRASRKGNVATP